MDNIMQYIALKNINEDSSNQINWKEIVELI